jgi:hypothetical protein
LLLEEATGTCNSRSSCATSSHAQPKCLSLRSAPPGGTTRPPNPAHNKTAHDQLPHISALWHAQPCYPYRWDLQHVQERLEVVIISAEEEEVLRAARPRQQDELLLQAEILMPLQVIRVGQINHDTPERRAYDLVHREAERRTGLKVASPYADWVARSVRHLPFELRQFLTHAKTL